ncbi:MAG: DUF4153 domain-containing protein [Sphingomicrobium sp.]
MAIRQDLDIEEWPLRPWLMATICAVAGSAFHMLMDSPPFPAGAIVPAWRLAGASFVAIAALSFVLTVETRRWTWSIMFAVGWGAVIAMIGWFTAQYNQKPSLLEWPYLAGLFAVMLAAPLFQTMRDEGRWRFPYAKLHGHAWTDAVIGAASVGFIGVTFIMLLLIGGLFDLIGFDLIKRLLDRGWFMWALAGLAFGAAVGLLRERDALVGTLQRLVMVVLGVLAPVLAAALILFLVSLPFTGFEKPNPWSTATPLMLSLAAASVLFANAVIGSGGDDRSTSRVLSVAALALVLSILPLALIAAFSMAQRIGQYGWTPERIWGVVAVAVAITYGLAGWWAVAKGRKDFDDQLRPLQTRMAIGLCALALFFALPIVDFGAISTRSQLTRLETGKVAPQEFDWTALAFDFGPAGRRDLARVSATGPARQRAFATAALEAHDRHAVAQKAAAVSAEQTVDQRLRLLSDDISLTDTLRQRVSEAGLCRGAVRCALMRVDSDRLLLITSYGPRREVTSTIIDANQPVTRQGTRTRALVPSAEGVELDKARVELRRVSRRQLYVDGKPVGVPFE